MIRNSTKGFTFIELMVVISIIGMLATIILAGVGATRKNARVAQRLSDMKRVQNALDLYYANNKSYPSTSDIWRGVCVSFNAAGAYTATNGQVIPGLEPNYLEHIPSDPQTSPLNDDNCYLYRSNGTDYAFLVFQVLEMYAGNPGTTYAKYPEILDPYRPNTAWKISTPGAVTW